MAARPESFIGLGSHQLDQGELTQQNTNIFELPWIEESIIGGKSVIFRQVYIHVSKTH